MQLDQTRIAVRERSLADLQDLALVVIRYYFRPLLSAFFAIAIPLALLNYALLDWMLVDRAQDELPIRYFWNMILLVAAEAQLASVASTMFLGQAVFTAVPRLQRILRDLLLMSWQLFICHGLIRGVAIIWIVYATTPRFRTNDWREMTWIPILLLIALVIRSVRPYITEIIVLERNRLTARSAMAMTIGRRSSALHSPASSALFGRFMNVSAFAVVQSALLIFTCSYLWGMLSNQWEPGLWGARVLFPLALWMIVLYVSVVRFLSYLDLRIRQEGWEVELRIRAEAARMARIA